MKTTLKKHIMITEDTNGYKVIDARLLEKIQAQIADAYAKALVYLNSSVGIGEHPQFIDELDKLVNKISSCR